MILLIDNYDSFTYNIVQYCSELGSEPQVFRNDQLTLAQMAELKPEKLLISPGPATPNEAGVTLEAIAYFADKIPILGICLGHQAIAQAFGGKVVRAKKLMHGKTSQVEVVRESVLFAGLPREFTATRYHSLVVEKDTLTDAMIVTALSRDDQEIMALQIKNRPIYGVQFHPESIMSHYGYEILENFLRL